MERFIVCLLLVGTLGAGTAFAGGSVTIKTSGEHGGLMTVAWDGDNVKLDPASQPAYMLMREGTIYSVTNAGGRTMVMDLSAMQGQMGTGVPETGARQSTAVESMEPTGQEETVAGIEGEVYKFVWKDTKGETRTDEAVLTDHAGLAALTRAMHRFANTSAALSGRENPDAIGDRLGREGLGVLRFGQRYQVIEVSETDPAPGEFELPAAPMKIPGMPRGR